MSKLVLWGFNGEMGKAIANHIRKNHEIVLWVGDGVESRSIWDFITGNIPSVALHAEAVREYKCFYEENFPLYQVMATRRGLLYRDFHELSNEFSQMYHFFSDLFMVLKVDYIIFANLPHEGADFILYKLARKVGVKTLMCYQSIFADRFFYVTRLGDFGSFSLLPDFQDYPPIDVRFGHRQDVFYMKEVEKLQAAVLVQDAKAGKSVQLKKIREVLHGFLKPLALLGKLNFTKFSNEWLQYKQQKRYEKNIESHEIDWASTRALLEKEQKLVYFPLHLQPELSTSTLGGFFHDQMYALEILRTLLGKDWKVLVKENPKQSYYQRDPRFFQRLERLDNVYLVDRLFPSVEIIEKAALTATITGTAGWEAIKGGGKCLVFGQTWYASLPNCLTYRPDINTQALEEFLSGETSWEEFSRQFQTLMKKAALGVVNLPYAALVPEFDVLENARKVSDSFQEIMENPKTVW